MFWMLFWMKEGNHVWMYMHLLVTHIIFVFSFTNLYFMSTVKLFINQPASLDFDKAEGMEAIQQLQLKPDDLQEGTLIPLKYVKFQNVANLTIFIKDNQGDEETTQLDYLCIIGSPVNTTNMSDFKRVAGKKGEAHWWHYILWHWLELPEISSQLWHSTKYTWIPVDMFIIKFGRMVTDKCSLFCDNLLALDHTCISQSVVVWHGRKLV